MAGPIAPLTATDPIGHTAPVTDAPRSSAATLSGGLRSALAIVFVAGALLVGCANPATTPAGPTPSPTAASAGPGGSPAPSASRTADPGTAALKAFVTLVTADGFSYQATFKGQSRHTADILPITKGLLQVSGDDVLVRATFTFPTGHAYTVEHRLVGGKGWIRYDTTDPWHRLNVTAATTMAAFAAVHGLPDLTYLGPVKAGAKTLYKVSFRSAIVNPVMIPATNLTEEILTSPRLILLIDAAGRPVSGTAEIDGHGRVSGQLQEIVIDLTVAFTKVGQAVTIHAP
jgi:hypothetical protein